MDDDKLKLRCKLGWHCSPRNMILKFDGGMLPMLCCHCRLILGHERHGKFQRATRGTPLVLLYWTPLARLLHWCEDHDSYHWTRYGHIGRYLRHP